MSDLQNCEHTNSNHYRNLAAVFSFSAILLLGFHETFSSMVATWQRSGTYAHGYLILPISLWLVWIQRDFLQKIAVRPVPWIALLMIPPGIFWLFAHWVDVLVAQQFAMVSMLILGIWSIVGHNLARAMLFPLFFLLFGVPMGEGLVPPMMEFTATSTVWLVQQTGVPIYREGMYFSLPSGNWSVVEACSGVRYMIASVTLGVLYAYLTYRSFWRRFLFVIVSLVLPIFANTLRAYIIVMLGHISDMKIATGVDHLVYGWVFFGVVVFLLFWVGSFFREDHLPSEAPGTNAESLGSSGVSANSKVLFVTILSLCAALVWPLLAHNTATTVDARGNNFISAPKAIGQWRTQGYSAWKWRPYSAVTGQTETYLNRDDRSVGLYIQRRGDDTDLGEVVGSSSRFLKHDSVARIVAQTKANVNMAGTELLVDQVELVGRGDHLLVWSWYRIGDLHSSNDYLAKLGEAKSRLGYNSPGSYRIVLVTPMRTSIADTQKVLRDFVSEYAVDLTSTVDDASEVLP